ncbi:Sir2 family NAD-dependent protein deacetylase [Vibrio sp. D431a]|uniref:SIR2 family NAD-dependent protein deacylase n=1 Tax=Vibrio sp. D431a TaxID=2837388 RepID=UPI002554CA39|nr:Sir2 family NAD-dependent protein deacetylase [Vibrio sp. D431a]MDK9789848.1 hypothetical protein [Vibrio sp. D431a]
MNQLQKPLTKEDYVGKKVLVLTGAGISVSAGIPCYWGENGAYKALEQKYGAPIEDVLSGTNLKRNPSQVWSYMKELFDNFDDVAPTLAHNKLVKLEEQSDEFHLVTQNCDGLHTTAGSKAVHEVHGTAHNAVCTVCGEIEDNYLPQLANVSIPRCTGCGGHLRPNVVLFEEMPKMDYPKLVDFARKADLLIVVGTQAYFSYITDLLNNFAATGGKSIWVDVEKPENLVLNWQISFSYTEGLEYYTEGADSFFQNMMPEL